MNLSKKEILIVIPFFVFSFFCVWGGIFYLLILFLFYKRNKEILIITFCLSSYYLYSNINDLIKKHDENISIIANRLNIDDYTIQEYYSEMGYKINFIGKVSNTIYASASKIVTLPCQDISRTDIFLLSGTHVRKLNEDERVPKSIVDETSKIIDSLSN